jgi:hypothetical protein
MYLADSWKTSLEEGSAHLKASTYTGQHKHRKKTAEMNTTMPQIKFKPMILMSERANIFRNLDC